MSRKSKVVVTPVGSASFCWLERPDTGFEFSDDKYKVTILFSKDSEQGKVFKRKVDEYTKELAVAEFGDKVKNIQSPLRDGDLTEKEDLHGHWFIRAKSKFQPGVIDCDTPPKPLQDGVFPRNGDLIRASVKLFAYKSGANQGVTAMLNTVQLVEQRNFDSAGFDDIAGYIAGALPTEASALGDDEDF